MDVTIFQLDRGRVAFEKWAAANHLTVQVYGADGQLVADAVNRTPLFDLFSRGQGPALLACRRQSGAEQGH